MNFRIYEESINKNKVVLVRHFKIRNINNGRYSTLCYNLQFMKSVPSEYREMVALTNCSYTYNTLYHCTLELIAPLVNIGNESEIVYLLKLVEHSPSYIIFGPNALEEIP